MGRVGVGKGGGNQFGFKLTLERCNSQMHFRELFRICQRCPDKLVNVRYCRHFLFTQILHKITLDMAKSIELQENLLKNGNIFCESSVKTFVGNKL